MALYHRCANCWRLIIYGVDTKSKEVNSFPTTNKTSSLKHRYF